MVGDIKLNGYGLKETYKFADAIILNSVSLKFCIVCILKADDVITMIRSFRYTKGLLRNTLISLISQSINIMNKSQ